MQTLVSVVNSEERKMLGTRLKPNGEYVATVQALMRHANVSVAMNTYVQAVTPAKRKAQRGIIKQIREVAPDPNLKRLQVKRWWAL